MIRAAAIASSRRSKHLLRLLLCHLPATTRRSPSSLIVRTDRLRRGLMHYTASGFLNSIKGSWVLPSMGRCNRGKTPSRHVFFACSGSTRKTLAIRDIRVTAERLVRFFANVPRGADWGAEVGQALRRCPHRCIYDMTTLGLCDIMPTKLVRSGGWAVISQSLGGIGRTSRWLSSLPGCRDGLWCAPAHPDGAPVASIRLNPSPLQSHVFFAARIIE
jgi:hypothetical protein